MNNHLLANFCERKKFSHHQELALITCPKKKSKLDEEFLKTKSLSRPKNKLSFRIEARSLNRFKSLSTEKELSSENK
jgi:hypothetical protein